MNKSLVIGAFRDLVKVIGGIRKASNHRMLLWKKPAMLLALKGTLPQPGRRKSKSFGELKLNMCKKRKNSILILFY